MTKTLLTKTNRLRKVLPDTPVMDDMPSLRKRLAGQEARRLTRLKEAKDNKSIRRMIENSANKEINPKNYLEPKQHEAVALIVDFNRRHTYEYIAKRIGIELQTLMKWRNSPIFLREIEKQILRKQSFVLINAYRNVNRQVMRGSMKDTWKYLEMMKHFTKRVEIDDKSREDEMTEDELNDEIETLSGQLANAHKPSGN